MTSQLSNLQFATVLRI